MISAPRLAPYLRITENKWDEALELYAGNVRVSSALYEILSYVEIGLRNRMDDVLREAFPADKDWILCHDELGFHLGEVARSQLERALAGHKYGPQIPNREAILKELSFGFWANLLSQRFEHTLWTPALRHAFPHLRPASRRIALNAVQDLRNLRNHIAHHESLLHRDKDADVARALEVLGWMSHDMVGWVVVRIRPGNTATSGTGEAASSSGQAEAN
jgi:hypothetical protein